MRSFRALWSVSARRAAKCIKVSDNFAGRKTTEGLRGTKDKSPVRLARPRRRCRLGSTASELIHSRCTASCYNWVIVRISHFRIQARVTPTLRLQAPLAALQGGAGEGGGRLQTRPLVARVASCGKLLKARVFAGARILHSRKFRCRDFRPIESAYSSAFAAGPELL